MLNRPFSYLAIISMLMLSGCLINGKVVNQIGAAMPDVTVNLSGADPMSTTTDSNGKYRFGSFTDRLPVGNYIVTPTGDFTPASRCVTLTDDLPATNVNFVEGTPGAPSDRLSGAWTLMVSNIDSSCGEEPGWSSTVTINQFDCSLQGVDCTAVQPAQMLLETHGIKDTTFPVTGSVNGDTVTIGPGNFPEDGGITTAVYTMTIAPDGTMAGTETWSWTPNSGGGGCAFGTADLIAIKQPCP